MINNIINKLKNPDLGLLFIRLGLAVVFIYHGWVKFQDIAGTTVFFNQLGLAPFFVYLVALVEVFGGLAMLLGVLTEWAGLILAIDMVFAIILVKFGIGFGGGYEFDLMLLLAALAILVCGPGKYNIQKFFKK